MTTCSAPILDSLCFKVHTSMLFSRNIKNNIGCNGTYTIPSAILNILPVLVRYEHIYKLGLFAVLHTFESHYFQKMFEVFITTIQVINLQTMNTRLPTQWQQKNRWDRPGHKIYRCSQKEGFFPPYRENQREVSVMSSFYYPFERFEGGGGGSRFMQRHCLTIASDLMNIPVPH